jgi:hypothetical protein
MTAFPDMVVSMDGMDREGDMPHYRWTLDGTNSGPCGKVPSRKDMRLGGVDNRRG